MTESKLIDLEKLSSFKQFSDELYSTKSDLKSKADESHTHDSEDIISLNATKLNLETTDRLILCAGGAFD